MQNVVVVGLGFVGAAMSVATARAQAPDQSLAFAVTGLDLPTEEGLRRVNALNEGQFPFPSGDQALAQAAEDAAAAVNLKATTDPEALRDADIVVVDINLDVDWSNPDPGVNFAGFERGMRTIAERVRPGTLVVVETTVPPGTCDRVVRPLFDSVLAERSLDPDAILLAHSYERVMPGDGYYDSIRNYWRVYAGETEEAAQACDAFLSNIVNIRDYPLTRLRNTTESEMAKVMENAYRATNIAFVEEWSRFAERVGVDMFDVIDAIRMRPTHANIRQPGFGVGGYCLTKDPVLGFVGANQLYGMPELEFPFSFSAVDTNKRMPLNTVSLVEDALGGDLQGKRILLLGVAYRQEIADTRDSASAIFFDECRKRGAEMAAYDPYVPHWEEKALDLPADLPPAEGFDAVVFAVAHRAFRDLDVAEWINGGQTAVIDGNAVLTSEQRTALTKNNIKAAYIGRGHHASADRGKDAA